MDIGSAESCSCSKDCTEDASSLFYCKICWQLAEEPIVTQCGVWIPLLLVLSILYTVGYDITLNAGNAQFVEQSSRNTNCFLYMELNHGEKKQKIWTTYPNSEKSIPSRPIGPRPLTATPPNNLGYMTLVTLICIFLIISGTYICSFVRDKSYSSEKAHYWFACHNFCRLSRSILPDSTSKIK